jgi:DNA-binding CsgD family transcriptional regulator
LAIPLDLLLDGFATLHLDGLDAAVPLLTQAVSTLVADTDRAVRFEWLGPGCWAAATVADKDSLEALATSLVAAARERGALVQLSIGLRYLAMSNELDGALLAARSAFDERAQLTELYGVSPDVGDMVVSAWTGAEDTARRTIAELTQYAGSSQSGWMFGFVDYARGVLELGLGNYEALAVATSTTYDDDWFLEVLRYPDSIEALVRCGRIDEARSACSVYSEKTRAMATPLSLGLLARTAALLADDVDVDKLFSEAIALLSAAGADLHLGRAHLLYGEWLRRQHRRIDARANLKAAEDIFASRGAVAFADRARRERVATGEQLRRRSPDTAWDLTPQETTIARMAADAHTNKEIAAKLFLSANTVDYHLRKVYRKLAIGSRRELAVALAESDGSS